LVAWLPEGDGCVIAARHIHRLSVTAALVAVGVAVGYMLAGVPNVEGISAVSFFAGSQLGLGAGALVGALAIGIFSMLNPLGPPLPQVLATQIVGMGMIGAAGHLWAVCALSSRGARMPAPRIKRWFDVRIGPGGVWAAAAGAVLTFIYSVLVDYGFAVAIGRWKDPVPVIVLGLPLSVVHIISNTLIFGALGAFLIRKKRTMGEDRLT
jgi:hypothetical protein